MITISYWALAAICLGLGAVAYGIGRLSEDLRVEKLRLAQLVILSKLLENGDVEVHVDGKERQDE